MYYKIKKYSVQELLIFIGDYNLEMFKEHSPIRKIAYVQKYGKYTRKCTSYICAWDLKDIAYNAIKYSNDFKNTKIELDSLYEILNEYRKIEDEKIINIDTASLFNMLYGLSQQQFWYQEIYESIEQFNRNVEMLKYISREVKTKIDMEIILQKVLGMSVDEYLYIVVAIFELAMRNIDVSEFAKTGKGIDFLDIEYSKIVRVFELYTANYEEIRMSPLEQNIFLAKPIVKTDKGKYIIHNSYLVLKVLSDGLYWVIRNYYCNMKSQLFTNEFGIYFEKYVENLFKFYLKDVTYFKPNEVKGKKIADWIIELDKYIIIIEQKSMIASLTLKKQFPNKDNLNKYINKYSEAFDQLNSTENELFKDRYDKRIVKLILHYDSLYSTELLKSEICINRNDTNAQDENIFFISIRELEILSYLINDNRELFYKVIEEKLSREDNKSLDGRDFHMVFKQFNIGENKYLIKNKNHLNNIINGLKSSN